MRARVWGAAWVLGGLAAGSLGCTQLIDVSDLQCEVDDDCLLRGLPGTCADGVCAVVSSDSSGVVDPVVRLPDCPESACPSNATDPICYADECVSEARVRPYICDSVPAADGDVIDFPIKIEEYTQPNRMLPNLTIKVCQRTDVLCDSPLLELRPPNQGEIDVPLAYGFDGFLIIDSDATIPFVWQFAQPLIEPGPRRAGRVLSPSTIETISGLAMVNIDQSLGVVAMQGANCAGMPSAGLHFTEPTGEAVGFYIVDLLPNLTVQETEYNTNGNFAVGGFFNMPPGLHVFTAEIGVGGPELGSVNANVLPGALTFLDIRP